MRYVREYKHNGKLVALLVRREFQNRRPSKHATFVSANSQSLQLGVGYYPRYLRAPAHTHRRMDLKARYEELLHLVRGRMRVDLYSTDKVKFASLVMRAGDTAHFVSGGHGFTMLSPCKCIEIKQGPYLGRKNKDLF